MDHETLRRKPLPPAATRRRVLVVVESPDRAAIGRAFPLDGSTWVLGREGSVLTRIDDRQISRQHLCVYPLGESGDYSVEDLKTSNGTYLDGVVLDEGAALAGGRVLLLGETLLVLDQEPEPSLLPAAARAEGALVGELTGNSFAADRMRRSIATVAQGRGSVLLLGKTGTGKEVAARAIHRLGARAGGPWVPVNCAAIPKEIAEAEFFGHRKGAFTGAIEDRSGYFAQASGGSLFLDEVGDLPTQLQAKLLRVLEEGVVQPIGGGPSQRVDLRVIAATHIDLGGSDFRTDLMARLGDWVLHLPSLHERRADILPLWHHFVAAECDGEPPTMTAEFAEALLLHDWPMNVRELQRLARRVVTLAEPGGSLALSLLPEPMQERVRARERSAPAAAVRSDASPRPEPVMERTRVESALREEKGNVRRVSQRLQVSRTQLYRWLQKLELDPDDFR